MSVLKLNLFSYFSIERMFEIHRILKNWWNFLPNKYDFIFAANGSNDDYNNSSHGALDKGWRYPDDHTLYRTRRKGNHVTQLII